MIIPLSYYTLPYFGLILDGCCSWTVSSCFMSWIFLIFPKKTDGMKFIIQDWIWLYDIVQQRRTLPLGNDDQMCILMGTTMSPPPCHQVIVFNIHIQRRQALWPVEDPRLRTCALDDDVRASTGIGQKTRISQGNLGFKRQKWWFSLQKHWN